MSSPRPGTIPGTASFAYVVCCECLILIGLRGHIKWVLSRSLPGAFVGVLALAGASVWPLGASALAASTTVGEGAGSTYPARAQYPRKLAHPGEYARPPSRGASPLSRGGHAASLAGGHKVAKGASAKKKAKHKPGLHGDPARALLAYRAMQQNYYIPGTGLYEGEPFSFLWPFSQALAATIGVANISGQSASAARSYPSELHVRLFGLQKYWGEGGEALPGEQPEEEEQEEGSEPSEAPGVAPPALPSFNGEVVPPGGASYYDDNEWVGIELVRLYRLRHEAQLLEKAEQIMAFVMAGWQSSPKLACPGGVPFSDSPSNTDRNTITNGPAAELGAELFRLTGNGAYLQFALTAYEWVRRCLLQPSGLYADHIRLHGRIDPTLWSYTQGSMIGAGALLYQATGNGAYLYQARQTANAALAYFTIGRLLSENPFFPAVYFRNLMYLDAITHDPPGKRLAQSWVDSLWVHQRLTSGLFVFGSPPSSQLLTQAAVVEVYALLSTPPATYF
jgi:glycosyl hydrolase family 76